MKKQLLKGGVMLVSIVALAFLTALVSNAQSRSRQAGGNVPFDFVVGEKTLAAGSYSVGTISITSADAVLVRSRDGRQKAIRLTNSVSDSANTRRARLVFHRYGNTYYLTQVWAAGANQGRELSKSKMERAEMELAKNSSGPEVVTIVAELE